MSTVNASLRTFYADRAKRGLYEGGSVWRKTPAGKWRLEPIREHTADIAARLRDTR